MGPNQDPGLEATRRNSLVAGERRAFARGFWWGGGSATLLALSVALWGLWSAEAVAPSRLIVWERLLYSLLVILVGGPFCLLLFGTGPGFLLLFWANVFPESIVAREFRGSSFKSD